MSRAAPLPLKAALAHTVADFDASLEARDLRTFGEIIDQSLARERVVSQLSVVFAMVAMVMAAVGIYGIVFYSVSRRTREIGIRMALGAQARTIAAMFVRETGWMVGAGVLVGCAGAVVANRVIASLLFGVTPTDPTAFGLSALALLAMSLLACWVPARRAARVDPVQSLRAE